MKKIFLCFLFIFLVLAARAQYKPLITEDKYWDIFVDDIPELQICVYTWGYRCFFKGDTLLYGRKYPKCYVQSI